MIQFVPLGRGKEGKEGGLEKDRGRKGERSKIILRASPLVKGSWQDETGRLSTMAAQGNHQARLFKY